MTLTDTATWDRVVVHADDTVLGPEPLRGLVNGDHAVIVLKGLVESEVFAANTERIMGLVSKAKVTQYVNGSLTLIGTFLVKNLRTLDNYWPEAEAADARAAAIDFDLAARVRDRLRHVFGMRRFDVAAEPDGRRYASSNVRICHDGVDTPLHNDNIMRDGTGYPVVLANLKHQLSCVICLQESDEGGELSVYRKPWEPEDERHKIPGGLGYDLGVVDGVPVHRFKPQTGDVYLLNPTYYHAIEKVSGASRITLGFFFGFFDDELDEGVTWV